MKLKMSDYVSKWANSPFSDFNGLPWEATLNAPQLISAAIKHLSKDYQISGDIAIHSTAQVEENAVLKGPLILGPNTFVASFAYLRGGVFLEENCIVGPSCELKTTFIFQGSKVAHLSFVGDSVIGENVNIEAGAIVANYRNEMADKRIKILKDGIVVDTGVAKFGALIGVSPVSNR